MKKFALIFNLFFVLQVFENNESQMVFESIEYIMLLIFFMAASIVMILIPIILCYSMVDNYYTMNGFKRKIKAVGCHNESSKYVNEICDTYLKTTRNFYKNFSALVTWNIFSLAYIMYGFENFSNGLKEYFYFPFAILQSLSKDEIFDSKYKFHSNFLIMGAIILLTFSFYFLGKYIGSMIAKNTIIKSRMKLTMN